MSYGIDFLSIELDALRNFFASGDSAVRQRVIEKGKEIYPGDEEDEEVQEARFVWEEIVRSLGGRKLGKYLAEQKPLGTTGDGNDTASQMKALAIACVVREFGENIAGVYHSTDSGEAFCTGPFEYLKQSGFIGRTDPYHILQRPLFNQISSTFPGWGGLTRTELAGISMDTLTSAIPDSDDSDVDAWVGGILDLIEEVKLRDLDLVTLYE